MFEVRFNDGTKRVVRHEGTAMMLSKAPGGIGYSLVFNVPDPDSTKAVLLKQACDLGIPGRHKMTKSELYNAIMDRRNAA